MPIRIAVIVCGSRHKARRKDNRIRRRSFIFTSTRGSVFCIGLRRSDGASLKIVTAKEIIPTASSGMKNNYLYLLS